MKRQYVQRPQLVNKFMRREGTPVKGKGGKGTPGCSVKCMGGSCQRQSMEGNPRPGGAIISGNVGLSINIHVMC